MTGATADRATVDQAAAGRPEVLTLRNLTAGHGGLAAVRGVDLEVRAGQVVTLLGPNGAGKTTILETIAGFLPVMSGEVRVVGAAPSVRRPHAGARRGLAYVPETRGLFRSLTVRQNLVLAARRGHADADSVYGYLPELRRLEQRDAGLLSGGEQQMLAIGRALLDQAAAADDRRAQHGPRAGDRGAPAGGDPAGRGRTRGRHPAGRAARAHGARHRRRAPT